MNEDSFADRWWELVCVFQPIIIVFMSLGVVFLVLALIARAFVDVGTSSHFILQITFVLISPLIVVSGLLLYGCRRR